jgi:hypothetical protein
VGFELVWRIEGLFHDSLVGLASLILFWGTPLQKTNAGALPLIIFHCCRTLNGWDYFMIPFRGISFADPFWGNSDKIKTQAASPQVFLLPKLAEASFARLENKKPTNIRGF